MDFRLNEDQIALREGIRQFCEGRVPVEQLGELEKTKGFDRELWGELAEMGVFTLRLSEEQGGIGLGMADAVLVYAELGRRLIPGPTIWSTLAAPLIEGVADGSVVVGGLDLAGGVAGPVLVEHLESIDTLIVLREDGVYQVDPKGLAGKEVEVPFDPLTPIHHVEDLPQGEKIADADTVKTMRLEGATLVSGMQLGIAEATLELANDYAKQREQFDRPIGGFQAVKHLLAEMFVKQEVARAASYAAGATVDDPVVGNVERAVSVAKTVGDESALRNSRTCIQVHGGMGFTWEVPAHYYLKRTWALATVFGTGEEHNERVADIVAEGIA